ncbi:MAG: hypothetical protein SFU55_04820 [Methylophilus sp.]|nr:hypothetical protein [Methylophilus sp.]
MVNDEKIDFNLIEDSLESGVAFNLILSKKQMSIFLEHAKDLPLYDVLTIKSRPKRPFFTGFFNIIYTSVFHKEIYELISFFYKNKKILMCEINKLNDVYELKFIPKS